MRTYRVRLVRTVTQATDIYIHQTSPEAARQEARDEARNVSDWYTEAVVDGPSVQEVHED